MFTSTLESNQLYCSRRAASQVRYAHSLSLSLSLSRSHSIMISELSIDDDMMASSPWRLGGSVGVIDGLIYQSPRAVRARYSAARRRSYRASRRPPQHRPSHQQQPPHAPMPPKQTPPCRPQPPQLQQPPPLRRLRSLRRPRRLEWRGLVRDPTAVRRRSTRSPCPRRPARTSRAAAGVAACLPRSRRSRSRQYQEAPLPRPLQTLRRHRLSGTLALLRRCRCLEPPAFP